MEDFKGSFGKPGTETEEVKVGEGEEEIIYGKRIDLDMGNPENAEKLERVLLETKSLAEEIKGLIQKMDSVKWVGEKIKVFASAVKKAMTVEKMLLAAGLITGGVLITSGGVEWAEKMTGTEAYADANTVPALKAMAGVMVAILSAIVPGIVKMKVPEKKKI